MDIQQIADGGPQVARSPLLGVIHDFLQEEAEGDAHKSTPGRFTPSSLPGCTRAVFYHFVGEEVQGKGSAQGWLRLEHGKKIHELLQGIFKAFYGDRFEAEVSFTKEVAPGCNIRGFCDGVVTTKSGKRFGLEIKSTAQKYFKKYKLAPDIAHRAQAIIYMECLDLDFMHVVYYNKNDELEDKKVDPPLPLKEFKVDRDPEAWQLLLGKMKQVMRAAETKTPPPQEVSFKCNYCPYFHTCQPKL